MEKLQTFALGTLGGTAVETVNHLPIPEIDPTQNTASLIIQVILALATLWKMFKKPKPVV